MNWKTVFSFALALLWLVGCAPTAEQPTATPPAEPAPTPTNTNQNGISFSMGITAEGAFYLGSGTAPVQMFDYSNFL